MIKPLNKTFFSVHWLIRFGVLCKGKLLKKVVGGLKGQQSSLQSMASLVPLDSYEHKEEVLKILFIWCNLTNGTIKQNVFGGGCYSLILDRNLRALGPPGSIPTGIQAHPTMPVYFATWDTLLDPGGIFGTLASSDSGVRTFQWNSQ